jgi:hypothetical protein
MAQPKIVAQNEITIDTNVPLPGGWGVGVPRTIKYPFRNMNVGASIFVSGQKDGSRASSAAVSWVRANKNGWKFASRAATEGGVVGRRIWRLA